MPHMHMDRTVLIAEHEEHKSEVLIELGHRSKVASSSANVICKAIATSVASK